MHVRETSAFTWLENAQRCIGACEIFATEFDFSDTDQSAIAAVLVMPEGLDLEVLLGRGAWKNLDRYARKKLGIPAEVFRHQHPMTVSSALTGALMDDSAPASLDETLWQYARSLGKPTTGVETFAEQIEILRSIPFEVHAKNLGWLLKITAAKNAGCAKSWPCTKKARSNNCTNLQKRTPKAFATNYCMAVIS